MNVYFDEGIAALQNRDFKKASYLLTQAVKRDPENVMAWLWLAKALPDPERRRRCIERALVIDPQHGAARRMLKLHDEKYGSNNGNYLSNENGNSRSYAATQIDDDPEVSDMLESADAPIIELPRPSRPRSMGKLIAEVNLDSSKNARRLAEVGVYVGLAAVLLLVVILPDVSINARILAGVAALIFFGYGLHHLRLLFLDRGRTFKLYQYGIEQNDPQRRWLWYDFTQLQQLDWQLRLPGTSIILLDVYGLTLRSESQKTWTLSRTFENCRDVGETMMARTEAMWVERDYEAIRRGEICRYHQTVVDEAGIRRGNIELTWDEVDNVEVEGGVILIHAEDGRTIREQFRGTWNAHVLIGLVERIIESQL